MKRLGQVVVLALAVLPTAAQEQRTRLFLKDGTYQLVVGTYEVIGNVVRYKSAERDGEIEEVPLKLVDLAATRKCQQDHAVKSDGVAVLSPELAREEQDRRSRTPEVAPNLRLPQEDSIIALDRFGTVPELVAIPQQGSDLNKETAHAVLKSVINPASSPHWILNVAGPSSDVQLHIAQPTFYVRLGEDDQGDTGGGAITVDTHGASGRETPGGGAFTSEYVIERLERRSDLRIVNSFRISMLGVKAQPDILEVKQETLPGGHWAKLTPITPLEPGEYALIEVFSDHELNLNVWDFGVNSAAKENFEAIRPEVKAPVTLKSR